MKLVATITLSILTLFLGCENEVTPPELATGAISGIAVYEGNIDNSGINILLEKVDGTNIYYTTSTTSTGFYMIQNVVEGSYTVQASSPNSSKKVYQTVIVRRGETSSVPQMVLDHLSNEAKPITWLGSFAGDPPSPALYAVYYNTTDGNSYIFDGEKWAILASIGATGETELSELDGKSMVWKGSLDENPANPEELWAYYNTTDGNAYIYTDSVWHLLFKDVSINYDEPTIVGSVADSDYYNLSKVFIKVVDEATNETAYNDKVSANGDFAVSGLDQSRTYTLYFSSEKLRDENINFSSSEILQDSTSTTYGAKRTGVRPLSGKAQDIGEVALSVNGTVMGTVTLSGRSDYSGIDVYLDGTGFATETETDGSWVISDIPQGSYTVRFYKDGYGHASKDIILYNQDPLEKPVELIESFELYNSMGSISGVVSVNNADGSAYGVEVKASNEDGVHTYTVFTTEDGSYSIPQVYFGKYTVTFSKEGYEKYVKTNLTVPMGQELIVNPSLSSSYGGLRITVGYSDREDHSGIVVNVYKDGSLLFSETTTPIGVVVVKGLRIGSGYIVTASADGYGSSAEADVSVESGVVRDVTLNSLSNRFGSVSGVVVDSFNKPVAGATVLLKSESGSSYTLTTDADGRFSKADVLAGEYEVSINMDGYLAQTLPIKYVVEASIQISIPDITLISVFGILTGFVVDAQDNQVDDAIVQLTAEDGTSISTLTADGSFSVKLKTGTYDVVITKPGYANKYFNNVVISPEQNFQLGKVTLAIGTTEISGKVVLSRETDFSGVLVTLMSPDSVEVASTTTDVNGFYSFMGIDEGEYVLRFQKEGFVTDQSVTLSTFEGEITQAPVVTLRSTRATVAGIITLESADDYSGITVQLTSVDDSSQTYVATTLQSGSFLITEVESGTYTVTISKPGYEGRVLEDVFIEGSAQKVLDPIVLSIAYASIKGIVELELKDDWAGALVTATSLNDPDRVYTATTNSVGRFAFAQMYPGEYRIVISADGYVSTTLPTIEVDDENEVFVGTVLLKIAMGSITGQVILEGLSDYSGVKVSLLGTDYETTTDEDGTYSFVVPAGNYPGGIKYECDGFKTASHVETIHLKANSTYAVSPVELKCLNIPYVSGSVSIRGISEENYGGIIVRIVELPGFVYVTGDDGKWHFEDVPVGKYTLEFERKNTKKVTKIVDFSAAHSITVENIELIPSSVTLVGKISLDSVTDYSGVAVRVTTPGYAEVSTLTEADGSFSISNIDASMKHTIFFEKDGWDSVSFEIEADTYEPFSTVIFTSEHEVVLYDRTAPVLTDIVAMVGSSTANGREISILIYGSDEGSGVKYVQVNTENSFENVKKAEFNSPYIFTIPDEFGVHTVYVRVEDAAGNISNTVSSDVVVPKYYTEISGTLEGDMLHLTKDKSPYRMIGDVAVDSDNELIIDPGVEIQVAGDYSIDVLGTLSAIGNEHEQIKIYGIAEGANGWRGIVLRDSGSIMSHVNINGLTKGVSGFCDIVNSSINADGIAVDITGSLLFSEINGNVSVEPANIYHSENDLVVIGNDISGDLISIYARQVYDNAMTGSISITDGMVEKNVFKGPEFSITDSFLKNNEISSSAVDLGGGPVIDSTFNSCRMAFGCAVINSVFNKCDIIFTEGTINNSNFIDCGNIRIAGTYVWHPELDCTGNFWGEQNTVEINNVGDNGNLSFINDWWDNTVISKVVYSGYKESEIEDIGYSGDEIELPDYSETYQIGDTGPAGGLIFFDKGYFSDGWRYLEAAPRDIGKYTFGYYRKKGLNLDVITSERIGTGRYNTERLVKYMDKDGRAFCYRSGSETDEYAARICSDYSYGGYDDWFLPSLDELDLMYDNLYLFGLGSFTDERYWSSSEIDGDYTWVQSFFDGSQRDYFDRALDYYIRPMRAF